MIKRIELTNSNVDELYIEIQERVELLKPGNYTDDEIYELYKKVRNLGLIWFDVEPRNIGRLLFRRSYAVCAFCSFSISITRGICA